MSPDATNVRASGQPAAPAGLAGGEWSVQTRSDDGAIADLAGEWDDLYGRCGTATPFQSHAWLASWWDSYGVPGRLRLVLVRHDGRLVAAAPLMLTRRRPWAVLTPVGSGLSDFTDVLVDDAVAPEATTVLAGALLSGGGWDIVDIPEARPGSASHRLFEVWKGRRWQAGASTCLEVAGRPLNDLLRDLPARTAKTVRRRLRRVDEQGITVRRADDADAGDATGALLRLHEREWQGRGVNSEHLRPRFARHLSRAAGAMVERGQAMIVQYRQEDQLVASEFLLVGHDFVGAYMVGFDPELRERIDIAAMMMREDMRLTSDLGRPALSMLRGQEPYKTRWRPRAVHNQRLLLARPGNLPARACALSVRGRDSAIKLAKARAPWLRTVRHSVRQAQARVMERLRRVSRGC